jgi:hypothetical protein
VAAEVQAVVDGPAKPVDSEQVARELVRLKKLTAYQVQQIYQGKGKNLVLGNYVVLDKLGQGTGAQGAAQANAWWRGCP